MSTEELPRRGLLIVFEGLDRSGKTTQSNLLRQALREAGHEVQRLAFPDRSTGIGNVIDAYLKGNEALTPEAAHLLFSANRWETRAWIEKLLARGENVVLDRYYYSGLAYSLARGLDSIWCATSDTGLHVPDIMFCFLDLSPEEQQRRAGFGGERTEEAAFQLEVKKGYKRALRVFENMGLYAKLVVYPDSEKPVDETAEFILGIVSEFLAKASDTPSKLIE